MKGFRKLQILLSLVSLSVSFSCSDVQEKEIGVQAHRGGASLYPENTIPAMINAVRIGTKTLELDLQVTRDSQVVVSHDSFLNSVKALFPDGERVLKEMESSLQIYSMDYDSLCKFDVGSLENPQYPRRKNFHCVVPLLTNLIDCVESYTFSNGMEPVNYNIEIKSSPESDGIRTPDYQTFCELSMKVLSTKNLKERLCVQSFDARALNYLHRKYPTLQLSYLVEDKGLDVADFLEALEFVPPIISPDHGIVDGKFVADAHNYRMKVIPWTVDEKEEVLRLKKIEVDEIITNAPDSVACWLQADNRKVGYQKAVSFFENLMGY